MSGARGRPAVFLDRDGVINEEIAHPGLEDKEGRAITGPLTPDEFEGALLPGVADAIARLKRAGYLTVVVSGQNNVAKGFLSRDALAAIDAKMRGLLGVDAAYYCTHHEDYTGPCACKKPKKGLLEQAVAEHGIDLSRSFMVGDRRIDMQLGDGCARCFYVASRPGEDARESVAMLPLALQARTAIVRDLGEAARLIVAGDRHPQAMREALVPCAGRGSGMGALTDDIPKPMIAFEGIPFLQFVLRNLYDHGVRRFVIPVGYKREIIEGYFGDGRGFGDGVEIVYAQSSVEIESGGSFKRGAQLVQDDAFVMQYGDAFLPCDLRPMWERFLGSGKLAMIVCARRGPLKEFESRDNIIVDGHDNIIGYDKRNESGRATLLDVGVTFFRKGALRHCEPDAFKLGDHIIPLLAREGEIIAHIADRKSVGIGNPEKIQRFREFLATNDLLERTRAFRRA